MRSSSKSLNGREEGKLKGGGYRIDCHQLWHGVSIPVVISGDSTLPKGYIRWERLALQERELIYTKAKIKVTSPREPATPREELENQMEVQECTEQSGTSWGGRGSAGQRQAGSRTLNICPQQHGSPGYSARLG